jgi:hypothetical protein
MRKLLLSALFCALPFIAASPLGAEDFPQTKLTVQVNSARSGKGIDRASVIVRFQQLPEGVLRKIKKSTRTNWETKTNQEGSVAIPEVPQGKVTIQIIADNYQTFGQVYDLNQREQTITIKLNAPQPQYSEDAKTKK